MHTSVEIFVVLIQFIFYIIFIVRISYYLLYIITNYIHTLLIKAIHI